MTATRVVRAASTATHGVELLVTHGATMAASETEWEQLVADPDGVTVLASRDCRATGCPGTQPWATRNGVSDGT